MPINPEDSFALKAKRLDLSELDRLERNLDQQMHVIFSHAAALDELFEAARSGAVHSDLERQVRESTKTLEARLQDLGLLTGVISVINPSFAPLTAVGLLTGLAAHRFVFTRLADRRARDAEASADAIVEWVNENRVRLDAWKEQSLHDVTEVGKSIDRSRAALKGEIARIEGDLS